MVKRRSLGKAKIAVERFRVEFEANNDIVENVQYIKEQLGNIFRVLEHMQTLENTNKRLCDEVARLTKVKPSSEQSKTDKGNLKKKPKTRVHNDTEKLPRPPRPKRARRLPDANDEIKNQIATGSEPSVVLGNETGIIGETAAPSGGCMNGEEMKTTQYSDELKLAIHDFLQHVVDNKLDLETELKKHPDEFRDAVSKLSPVELCVLNTIDMLIAILVRDAKQNCRHDTEDFVSVKTETIKILEHDELEIERIQKEDFERFDSHIPVLHDEPKVAMFERFTTELKTEERTIPLFTNETGVRKSIEHSTRFDLTFDVIKIHCKREIGVTSDGCRITPDVDDEIGPKRSIWTWGALCALTVMIVQFAFPASRLGLLCSSRKKTMHRSTIWDALCYVAETLVPAYFDIFNSISLHSRVICGDDTGVRTRETEKRKEDGLYDKKKEETENDKKESKGKKGEKVAKKNENESDSPPNDGNKEKVKEEDNRRVPRNMGPHIVAKLRELMPMVNEKKGGKSNKTKLHTTAVLGNANPLSEKEWSILYVSHLGSFGDILTKMLEKRRKRITERAANQTAIVENIPEEIVVLRDECSQNNPRDLYGFKVTEAGCLMHARRKFHNPEPEAFDDIECYSAYVADKMITQVFRVESWLTKVGRTPERVSRIRQRYVAPILGFVERLSRRILSERIMPKKYRDAANYFVNNIAQLRAHIKIPHIPNNTGMVERALRTLKLFENSSFGHATERGRLTFDVIRSVMATCNARNVKFADYFTWVAKTRERYGDEEFHLIPSESLSIGAFIVQHEKTVSSNK